MCVEHMVGALLVLGKKTDYELRAIYEHLARDSVRAEQVREAFKQISQTQPRSYRCSTLDWRMERVLTVNEFVTNSGTPAMRSLFRRVFSPSKKCLPGKGLPLTLAARFEC
jgi:hypothetical protein